MIVELRTPTEVTTFRMPKARVDQLKKEAQKHHLTTNAVLNQIIESYFEFSSVATSVGMMPFSKRLLKEMMSQLDEKKISSLSKMAAELDIPDLIYMKENKFTTNTFLDTLLAWSRYSGFHYLDTFEDEGRTITMQHNLGPNWSRFMTEVLEIIFEKLEVHVSFERYDDILIIHIKNGHP